MSKIEEVRGSHSVLQFEAKKCIHSRSCVLDRPDVFVPNVPGAWIHPDQATPGELDAVARNCPSGAITCLPLDGRKPETPPLVNVARIRENGPLALSAEITLGGQPAGLRATLCRCGASANKPYCDGSHSGAGFVASGEPATVDSQPLATRNGPLSVTPLPNGPLLFSGNLEICTGTGKTINRVTKTALCRCGQSANKPYCDGTHTKIGFQTQE